MSMNTINKEVFFLLILVLLVGCKTTTANTDEVQRNSNSTKVGCAIYSDSLWLGSDIFKPFEAVFHSFEESEYDYDLLIREIGQKSNLIRFYNENYETFYLEKYDKTQALKIKVEDFNSLANYNEISGMYLCNEGSSDLGTHIYALKKKGKFIVKLWLENGDLEDLGNSFHSKNSDFINLVEKVKQTCCP